MKGRGSPVTENASAADKSVAEGASAAAEVMTEVTSRLNEAAAEDAVHGVRGSWPRASLAGESAAEDVVQVAIFSDRATSHTKNIIKRVFGYPEFWGTKIAV